MGRIQCQTVPVPEVGSQPSPTANTTMATMATQKSGAEAPISEVSEAMRSKTPPTRNAASEPTTMAAAVTSTMVMTAVSMTPMVTLLNPGGEAAWYLWVPGLAQNTLMMLVLKGESLSWAQLMPSVLMGLLLMAGGLFYVTRSMRAAVSK